MVTLATQLIDRQSGPFEPADLEDRYEAKLRQVIDAKLAGEGMKPDALPEEEHGSVIDLMAALKRSLGQTSDAPGSKRRATPAAKKAPPRAKRPFRQRKQA